MAIRRSARVFAARAAQLDVTARLEHVPGDKVSGDWTGDCPHLTDPVTGRRMKAQVFVAVLPYSGLIFARATPDQRMASWLEAHRNMLEWFEGVPNMLVPGQCATAVDRTPRGLMETRRRQAVSGIRRALRDRGRAGARVQATRQGAGAGRPWTWSGGGSSSPRGMRRSARSWIPDDYIGERVMWLNRRHATPGRDSRRERYRGRGTTDAAALLPAESSCPCQWRKAKVLSDTAISASRRMILLRAPRTGAGGPWT